MCEGLAQISALGLGNVCICNPLALALGALLPQDRTEQSRQDILKRLKPIEKLFSLSPACALGVSKAVVLFWLGRRG